MRHDALVERQLLGRMPRDRLGAGEQLGELVARHPVVVHARRDPESYPYDGGQLDGVEAVDVDVPLVELLEELQHVRGGRRPEVPLLDAARAPVRERHEIEDVEQPRELRPAHRIVKPAHEVVAGVGELAADPVLVEASRILEPVEETVDREEDPRDVPAVREQLLDGGERGLDAARLVLEAAGLDQPALARFEVRAVPVYEGPDLVEGQGDPGLELPVLLFHPDPVVDLPDEIVSAGRLL